MYLLLKLSPVYRLLLAYRTIKLLISVSTYENLLNATILE